MRRPEPITFIGPIKKKPSKEPLHRNNRVINLVQVGSGGITTLSLEFPSHREAQTTRKSLMKGDHTHPLQSLTILTAVHNALQQAYDYGQQEAAPGDNEQ